MQCPEAKLVEALLALRGDETGSLPVAVHPPPRQKMVGLSPIGVRKNVILVYVIPEQNNVNQQF